MNREMLLLKFEFKKILSQRSTLIVAVILALFPVIIVFGIVSPSPQFSITMDDFSSPSDFSNAMLGFLNSLGFFYIILVLISSSIISKELESKYIYHVLSAVSSIKRLFLYKIFVTTIVFFSMLFLSSTLAYIAYSTMYLKQFSITVIDAKLFFWGMLISFLVVLTYTTILAIVGILSNGSIIAPILTAVGTIIISILASAINGVIHYVPAWAFSFKPDRNNLLLVSLYVGFAIVSFVLLMFFSKKKNF